MSASTTPPTDRKPFISVAEAARLAGMSQSNIRRRAAIDGFAVRPGGRGPYNIVRERFVRWLAGEKLR